MNKNTAVMEMSFQVHYFKVYFRALHEGFREQVATMGSIVPRPISALKSEVAVP